MKCDNIKLCKISILVSTFITFDNRDKALICLPALLHNNAPYLPLSHVYSVLHLTFQNLTYDIAVS